MAVWFKLHCLLSVELKVILWFTDLSEPLGNSILEWLGRVSHLLKLSLKNYRFGSLSMYGVEP